MLSESLKVRAARLEVVEAELTANPADVALLYERARILAALGRREEARDTFYAVIGIETTHYGALVDVGVLLYDMGEYDQAIGLYRQIVRLFPNRPLARVNFGQMLWEKGELEAAREQYQAAVDMDPHSVLGHQGLAVVLTALGDDAGAEPHRLIAFARHPIRTLRFRGTQEPIRVLQIVSAIGGNVPAISFFDDVTFQLSSLFGDYYDPQRGVPVHHFIFNSVGDADMCPVALAAAGGIIAGARCPVINQPAAVAMTARSINADRLSRIEGVVSAKMALLARASLEREGALWSLAAQGFEPPFLLRAPGFHTGQYFERVEGADDFAAAVAAIPGSAVLAMQYIDSASADGLFRKYRVMIIDGVLYPLHLAIARHWKVHYAHSDMADEQGYRDEEAAFLNNMPAILGTHVMGTLERVRDMLGLDYAGIDFAIAAEGRTVVFEANATMNIIGHDKAEGFGYRTAAVKTIRDAVRAMLLDRAAKGGYASTSSA
jgi:glutathione synthase/RimK-type ligase-like ATP-grasp enzyme